MSATKVAARGLWGQGGMRWLRGCFYVRLGGVVERFGFGMRMRGRGRGLWRGGGVEWRVGKWRGGQWTGMVVGVWRGRVCVWGVRLGEDLVDRSVQESGTVNGRHE